MKVGGQLVTVKFTELTIDGENIVLRGSIVPEGVQQVPYSGIEAPQEAIEETRPRIRSYLLSSALMRMMSNGQMVTSAITHCTDKAWRVINLQYGVCWIPRNIIRWSEIANQFCVVAQDWEPDWCKPTEGLDSYPSLFDPDKIIPELNIHINQ